MVMPLEHASKGGNAPVFTAVIWVNQENCGNRDIICHDPES